MDGLKVNVISLQPLKENLHLCHLCETLQKLNTKEKVMIERNMNRNPRATSETYSLINYVDSYEKIQSNYYKGFIYTVLKRIFLVLVFTIT